MQAWCGSGYKSGNEQCDDGNLAYLCDPQRFECQEVPSGVDPKQLRKNDGCNTFCEIESSFGWECTPGAQREGFGGALFDLCPLWPCACWPPAAIIMLDST